MTDMTWERLQEGRKIQTAIRSSAHLVESIEIVHHQFPGANIVQVGENSFVLKEGNQVLSHPHPNHYDCWLEVREILNGANAA
jgi:hypothetical protein